MSSTVLGINDRIDEILYQIASARKVAGNARVDLPLFQQQAALLDERLFISDGVPFHGQKKPSPSPPKLDVSSTYMLKSILNQLGTSENFIQGSYNPLNPESSIPSFQPWISRHLPLEGVKEIKNNITTNRVADENNLLHTLGQNNIAPGYSHTSTLNKKSYLTGTTEQHDGTQENSPKRFKKEETLPLTYVHECLLTSSITDDAYDRSEKKNISGFVGDLHEESSDDLQRKNWQKLLFERPATDNEEALSLWLKQILVVSDIDTFTKLVSRSAEDPLSNIFSSKVALYEVTQKFDAGKKNQFKSTKRGPKRKR